MNTGDNLVQTWTFIKRFQLEISLLLRLVVRFARIKCWPQFSKKSKCVWLPLLDIRHLLQWLTRGHLKYLKCLMSLKKHALHVVAWPSSMCSQLLQFPPRAVLWIQIWTEMIRNRIGPQMWFKLYVKNSEQLVSSVLFLKEITTCFYTTL